MEYFDYSQVPYGFGLCAAADCPRAATCLRRIALEHAPAEVAFVPMLNPRMLAAMKGECQYYRPDRQVRYARGFIRMLQLLTVRMADAFRCKLIARFGRKNYYLARKGDYLLKPADQEYIIRLAREAGLELEEYFDSYVYGYEW